MSEKLKGPDGATNAQVDGIDYEVGEDGLFVVDNHEHVLILMAMGFIEEAALSAVIPSLAARYPRVTAQFVTQGRNISTVTTGEQLLDLIEAQMESYYAPEEEAPATEAVDPASAAPPEASTDDNLDGSSVLPALIDVGAAEPVQLGTVVAAAHARSGLDVAAWNALEEPAREALLATEVETMRAASVKEDGSDEPVIKADSPKPNFSKMTRKGLVDWMAANGKPDMKATDDKNDLVVMADAHYATLTPTE